MKLQYVLCKKIRKELIDYMDYTWPQKFDQATVACKNPHILDCSKMYVQILKTESKNNALYHMHHGGLEPIYNNVAILNNSKEKK